MSSSDEFDDETLEIYREFFQQDKERAKKRAKKDTHVPKKNNKTKIAKSAIKTSQEVESESESDEEEDFVLELMNQGYSYCDILHGQVGVEPFKKVIDKFYFDTSKPVCMVTGCGIGCNVVFVPPQKWTHVLTEKAFSHTILARADWGELIRKGHCTLKKNHKLKGIQIQIDQKMKKSDTYSEHNGKCLGWFDKTLQKKIYQTLNV